MQAFGRLSSYISQGVYTVSAPFHPFGGAVDIIVIQQQDGSFKSSPWYVQFGKFQGVLRTQEKVVKIRVNEADAGFHMYLDHKGEAFFLKESDNGVTDGPIASPLTSEDETDEGPQIRKSQMLEFESNRIESVSKIDVENGKIVARTNSRRSRIFGFFGRRSMREERGQDKVNIQRLNSLQSAEMAADLLEMKWSTNLPTTTITGRNLPKPPSRKDDKEVTGMNIVEKGTLSSGKDPDSCSQGRNLTQSLSDKDEGKESNMNVDEKRSFSSGKDPHPCSPGNVSVSGAELADMELSGPADTGEGSQCIKPQEEEDAASPSVCPVLYISQSSASGDRDEKITDMLVFAFEKSDRAVVSDSHTVETVTVESKEITSLQDTTLEISDEILKGPSLSSDYVVETVMLDTETKLPEDGVLDNSNKAVEHPLVIAPVDNEEKTPVVDPVLEKFQEIEVPSPSRNYSIQTVTSNSKENASDDGNVDVSGISNPNLNPKLSVQESQDTDISSCVLYETEAYETSTVMLDFVDNELQTSGATRDRNELVAANEQESYGAAKFVTEVIFTPQPVTSASENHQICHNSPFTGNLNCCGDTTNLEQGAIENSSECDKTKSSDSESQKNEMQFPSDIDIESYESIVKILHENTVNLENKEKRYDTMPDKKIENQAQVEEGMDTTTSGMIGAETFQHSNSLDLESKNTTLLSIAKTNSFGPTILEEVAIGVIDNSVEIVSVRGCGSDNCSKSDPVASGDDEMPKSSEGDQFIDRNIDKISSNGPPPQQLIADVNIEDNLLHARMKYQNSMLTSVDDNKSFDDCYHVSKIQSSEIKSPTSPDCAESNAFVQSTLSEVSSGVSSANDLDDLYSVSCFNQLSSSDINIDENEECTLLEGSDRKQVDQTSNASAAEHDVCNIAETIKGTKLAVEVSLCRHLLFEGMGEAAASKAFDAEKLNLDKFAAAGPAIVKNSRLIVKIGCHYFPWEAAAPLILGLSSYDKDDIFEPEGAIPIEKVEKSSEQDPSKSVNPSGSWRLWPFGFTKPKGSEDRSPDENKEIGTTIGSDDVFSDIKNMPDPKDTKKIVRSRIPSSEQLASLNLKEGQNSVTFSFETAMLGRQQVDARIYLWKWNARIVISDVDGTITKSDVLGQFMPLIGKDWSQTGVAHLFSAIKENGYQFIFLSARSISQAYITRQFLFNLKQDGKALPDGPVVISPDGLFPSLYREVIRRAPHEFKISCLEDIRALFPPDCNPFYAGFGNRHTDEISYVKVGVPKGKTFTINPRGEVVINRTVDAKSYVSLHALVDAMFPPTTSSEQEEFNSWNFWKPSVPDIKI